MDMPVIGIIIVVILAAVIAIAVILHLRKQAYIKSLTDRGWTFVDHPTEQAIHGLNCPPFGLGENRQVDDQVIGTTASGIAFQAVEYKSSTYRGRGYVVRVPLPRSMPEFYHLPNESKANGATGTVVHQDDAHTVVAADPDYGRMVLGVIQPTLGHYGTTPVNLSIDHDQLVGLGAPKEVESLAPYLEALAGTARALGTPALQGFRGPQKPERLSIYRRPDWEYRNRDDSLLAVVEHSGGGQNHRAEGCIISTHPTLPFVALTHRWETTRTVTSTDSEGRTTTRTVTDHHSEEIVEFHPRFTFGPFKVNRGLMGDRVRFEWHDFDQAFTVRCRSTKFASDVFHPRQLEYLMEKRPLPFEWTERGTIQVSASIDVGTLKVTESFLQGFFGRVPNFVWEDLGYRIPPVAPAVTTAGQ